MTTSDIPPGLSRWFVLHFAADMLFALPLMFAPVLTMELLGWSETNPLTARLTGAALMGIGGQSLLSRKDTKEAFLSLLSMKLIWSGAAILAIVLTIVSQKEPPFIWVLLAVFAGFNILWAHYFRLLRKRK